ncbi:Fibroblast growth factor receptor-like 1 [Chamberlinius hualienensis]
MDRFILSLGYFFILWGCVTTDSSVPKIRGDREIELLVDEGGNATLECPVERSPSLMIEWYKDGRMVDHQILDKFKIPKKFILVIYNVTQEEAGTFVCRAINGFGTVEVSFSLIVHEKDDLFSHDKDYLSETDEGLGAKDRLTGSKPVFTKLPTPQKGITQKPLYSSIHLKCIATGHPTPTIQWLKDGKELRPEKNNVVFRRWTLYLQRLQRNNSGEYTCIVRNVHGAINATFLINVIAPGPRQPVMTELQPLNTTVEYGGMAHFQCRVKSDAVPHIQWLKKVDDDSHQDGIEFGGNHFKVLKPSEVVEREEGLYLNKLMLTEVKESDSGMYVCLAANTMGYSYKEALLTVQPGHAWPESGPALESSGLGGFALTLVICIPLIIIGVGAVLYILVRCRSSKRAAMNCSKRTDNRSACAANTNNSRCPAKRASSSSSCAYSKSGNYVHKPIYNNEPQSDLLLHSQQTMSGAPAPTSSWSLQQPSQHHYRKSGTATPSSSNGETRSGLGCYMPAFMLLYVIDKFCLRYRFID